MNSKEILFFHLFNRRSADSLSSLMALEDEAFVHAATHVLLDNPLTDEPFESYVLRLRCGESKLSLLAEFAQLPSQSNLGRLPGLRRWLQKYRLSNLPWVGVFFRRLWSIPSETLGERRLRVIENQLYLLAKHLAVSDKTKTLPFAPWGGVGSVEWLSLTQAQIDGLSPEVGVIHEKLVAVAHQVASTSVKNASAD